MGLELPLDSASAERGTKKHTHFLRGCIGAGGAACARDRASGDELQLSSAFPGLRARCWSQGPECRCP